MIWRDEIGDSFVLVKYGEIFRYGENTLRLLTWSRQMCAQLRLKGVILNETSYDDGFVCLGHRSFKFEPFNSTGSI